MQQIAVRILSEGWDYFFSTTKAKLEQCLLVSRQLEAPDYDTAQAWFVKANMLNTTRSVNLCMDWDSLSTYVLK